MIPSEYGSVAPTASKSSSYEVRHDDLTALEHMRAVESPGEELQLRELERSHRPLENAIDVRPRLDEISRKPKRLRRRLRVLEPAGIGDERDVQRLGDLRREREVELVEHVGEDLAGRGRIRDDEVDVPEARVVVVMVDVDDERRRVDRARLGSHPTGAGAVDRDEHALAEVGRALSPEPALLQLEEPVLPGRGAGPPRNITTSLPSSARARPIANSEPSASPSGASCEVTTKRSFSRRAAATACMSVWVDICLRGAELVDDLRQLASPRSIAGSYSNVSDRRPSRAELASDLRLEHAVRRLQAGERARLLLLVPEHAHEDRRLRQVFRRPDARHRDEADPRVLQRRQGIREHLPHGLVRPSSDAQRSPGTTTSRSARMSSHSCDPRYRSTASSERLELGMLARRAGHREGRALPEIVVVDLGHRGPEALVQLAPSPTARASACPSASPTPGSGARR